MCQNQPEEKNKQNHRISNKDRWCASVYDPEHPKFGRISKREYGMLKTLNWVAAELYFALANSQVCSNIFILLYINLLY